jgi:hypothetical protein
VGCKKRSGEGWYARLFDKVVYDVYTQWLGYLKFHENVGADWLQFLVSKFLYL